VTLTGTACANLRWCPTQFQRYVPGVDYRVHVLGDEVFAARVTSDADDYRYAASSGHGLEVRSAEIPSEIANRCRRLTATMGLSFAGIDLRLSDDERWYCFEVNPSPGFSFYQDHTGAPIDLAVARYLAGISSAEHRTESNRRRERASAGTR
jgi:glutathione synthase/RimK-type ligase-like ATP-grasp enzyme